MPRKLIAGNWKMNGALAELDAIAVAAAAHPGVDVAICPPFTLIAAAAGRVPGLAIGGQDTHAEDNGAHTGSISAPMLKDAGASLVIVGHSERRAAYHETDADVRGKAEAARRHGLAAIVCVGESDADRQAGRAVDIVSAQLEGSLPREPSEAELVVAYEPTWAIGTGKVATPADVAEMHAAIRSQLRTLLGPAGDTVRILYGGSVKADNAAELFAVADVDGALVGGASLTAAALVPIVAAAAQG